MVDHGAGDSGGDKLWENGVVNFVVFRQGESGDMVQEAWSSLYSSSPSALDRSLEMTAKYDLRTIQSG